MGLNEMIDKMIKEVLQSHCSHDWQTMLTLDKFSFSIREVKYCDKCGEKEYVFYGE